MDRVTAEALFVGLPSEDFDAVRFKLRADMKRDSGRINRHRIRRVERLLEGARVGFDLVGLFFIDKLDIHAVDIAAAFEFLQAGQFAGITRYHQLAGFIHRQVMLRTIVAHRLRAIAAEAGFERIGRVIEARMHDSAIAAAAVTGDLRLFFKQHNPRLR